MCCSLYFDWRQRRICWLSSLVVFFNDPATTEIYTLSLHDALPISTTSDRGMPAARWASGGLWTGRGPLTAPTDRKSTRLNSSHTVISYAVFCLKKKKNTRRAARTAGGPPPFAHPRRAVRRRARKSQ